MDEFHITVMGLSGHDVMELTPESIIVTAILTLLGVLAQCVLSFWLTHWPPKQDMPVKGAIRGHERTRAFVLDIRYGLKSERNVVLN